MSTHMLSPDQIKAKIHGAFSQAPTNVSIQRFGSTQLEYELRDLRLFGRDAGTDFVETYLGSIINEAVEMAGQRQTNMSMTLHRCGKQAVEALAQGLRDRTGLAISVSGYTVTLVWADNTPRMI